MTHWSEKPEVRVRIPEVPQGERVRWWFNVLKLLILVCREKKRIKHVVFRVGSNPTTIYRVVEESGLSRCIWDAEHVGSNPAYPTINCPVV